MADQGGDLVAVYDASGAGEAYTVVSVLEGAGIQAVLMDETSVWGGHNVDANRGYYARVAVPKEFSEHAMKLLAEYEAEAQQDEDDEPTDFMGRKYTESAHRSCCGMMAFVSMGAMIWAYVGGYTTWMILGGICAFAIGASSRGYTKLSARRFHDAIIWYSWSYGPIALAFVLGAASAKGWLPVPTVIYYALCAASAAMFTRGAITSIPRN